jgi:hypothetical protein
MFCYHFVSCFPVFYYDSIYFKFDLHFIRSCFEKHEDSRNRSVSQVDIVSDHRRDEGFFGSDLWKVCHEYPYLFITLASMYLPLWNQICSLSQDPYASYILSLSFLIVSAFVMTLPDPWVIREVPWKSPSNGKGNLHHRATGLSLFWNKEGLFDCWKEDFIQECRAFVNFATGADKVTVI